MVRGGRWERGSGWGTCVHSWQIHVDVWQNQYNIVKLKKKKKKEKKAEANVILYKIAWNVNCKPDGLQGFGITIQNL